jgi:methyltransferase (TIGR00027 family)
LIEATPSRTAYRVALRRAAHQVFDDPVVFRDPLALRILGMTRGKLELNDLRAPRRPYSRSLRAFVVARARLAEDTLHDEVEAGATQYLLLGAGLDTFAYRNPHDHVRVFEVDHPATQLWKRQLLQDNGIAQPETCRYVPVDFENDDLIAQLLAAGFDPGARTVIAWLGVVPYLTAEAMRTTLRGLASLRGAMKLVLDYSLPRAMLPPNEQLALDSLSARVAQAGEPFQQFFAPEEMERELGDSGWSVLLDLDSVGINARFFLGRCDDLGVLGKGAHLLVAGKP